MEAARLNPEGAQRCRGDFEHNRLLSLWQISGDEHPCLSKRLGQREPPGHCHQALHRHVVGKTLARLCHGARKILLDEHPCLATGLRRERCDLADEIVRVGDGRGVPTAAVDARLEYCRELHRSCEGFDCGEATVGRDVPAKRRRQAAVAERLALQELVHKAAGHLWRVVVESHLRGYQREGDDILVAVGHGPVGSIGS